MHIIENNPLARTQRGDEIPQENPTTKVQIVAQNEPILSQLSTAMQGTYLGFENCEIKLLAHLTSSDLSSLIPVVGQTLSDNKITIFIGCDISFMKAVFDGFQFAEKPFNVALVQSSLGLERGVDTVILPVADPHLHCAYVIGSQAMYSDVSFYQKYADRGLVVSRLGHVGSHIPSVEPAIRSSQLLSIDLSAIKHADAPFQLHKSPVGFSVEKACQLAYYGGRAERNKAYCIYGMVDDAISHEVHKLLVANLVWYFLQGVDARTSGYPIDVSTMQTYLIDGDVEGLSLEFYKDEAQQKWWLKNPIPEGKWTEFYPLIACDYNDYASAIQDRVISDRIRQALMLL